MSDTGHQEPTTTNQPQGQGAGHSPTSTTGGGGGGGGGGSDDILKAVHEAKSAGMTPHLHEELEHLTPRALDRFVTSMGDEPKYVPIIKEAKEIKEKKEKTKEMIPHNVDEKKDGLSSQGFKGKQEWKKPDDYHMEGGKLVKTDASHPDGNEYIYDRQKGQKGVSATGQVATEAQKRQEEFDKKKEAEEREKEGFLAKHTHVGGTLIKGEKKVEAGFKGEKKFGDPEGAGGDIHGKALHAEATAGGEVGWSKDKGLKVGGNAGATATLVSGGAEIHSKPIPFSVGGESFNVKFSVGVDAGVIAEAKGNIELNASPSAQGVEASVSGFAGARVTGSLSGQLDWLKRSGESYAADAAAAAPKFLSNWMPDWVISKIPTDKMKTVLEHILPYVLGKDAGDTLILGATAKGTASAGIGANASFSAGLKGGVVHCHGKFGVTFGVGAGGDLDVSLGLVDGMRMLGVMLFKGANAVGEALKPAKTIGQWLKEKAAEAKQGAREYCTAFANDNSHGWVARHIMEWVGDNI